MIGLIGKKLGQTRIFVDGKVVPVTVVQAGPNFVIQCKTEDSDGYNAVQLGFDQQKESRLNKPLMGHLRKFKSPAVKRIQEFRDFEKDVKPGDTIGAELFSIGDSVDVIGTTKGKGFQGVVRRYNFGGAPRTHGSKGFYRRPGSIGAGSTPGLVSKGKKLPGHMGGRRRTVQNLKVVGIREEEGVLLISGTVPGANNDYVVIRGAKKRPRAEAK